MSYVGMEFILPESKFGWLLIYRSFMTVAGDTSKAVRQEAAKAVGSLVQLQKVHGQPLKLLALACLSADQRMLGGDLGLAHWQCLADVMQQGPKDVQHIDVILGLEQVQALTNTFLFQETDEDVQVMILHHAQVPALLFLLLNDFI